MTAGLRSKEATANRNGLVGTAFVHTVIGDRSRVAYSEICSDDEATTIGVRQRAVVCFPGRGVTVERLLSDNGSAYRTHARRESHTAVAIIHSDQTQTSGKIERFHRTLSDGWAHTRMYESVNHRPQETHRRTGSVIAILVPSGGRLRQRPGRSSSQWSPSSIPDVELARKATPWTGRAAGPTPLSSASFSLRLA